MDKELVARELLLAARDLIGQEGIFEAVDKDALIRELKDGIRAPFVSVVMSTLGGAERASLMVSVSLDPKETWQNGIFHNSRYFMLSVNRNGVVEQFSSSGLPAKMRKTRVKSVDEAVRKINAYIQQVG